MYLTRLVIQQIVEYMDKTREGGGSFVLLSSSLKSSSTNNTWMCTSQDVDFKDVAIDVEFVLGNGYCK